MKNKKLILERTKSCVQVLRIIAFPIITMLFLTSLSLANDKFEDVKSLNLNQTIISKNVFKENYHSDTKTFENFYANLADMNPQEVANNIENFSNKYNININNVSENIVEESDNWFNEDIIVQSSDEEKILLIKFSGKITIKDTIDFYKLGIIPYSQVSRNIIIAKVKAGDIENLKSYPFINKIREYKPDDKINPYDKIRIDQIILNSHLFRHYDI